MGAGAAGGWVGRATVLYRRDGPLSAHRSRNFSKLCLAEKRQPVGSLQIDSTKVRIGFPVTAELSSTTRERLRGVLVDARLGVTGKGYGAHGLSGHRPQREFNLPAMIERGSTIRGRLRGHAPGFPEVGVRA